MRTEKEFSLERGFQGCLVSGVMALLLALVFIQISLLLDLPENAQDVLRIGTWLFTLAIGGYVAARAGRTTGWSNALVVGVFAELYVLGNVFHKDDQRISETWKELMSSAPDEWPKFVALTLTVPAAVAGGILWDRAYKKREAEKATSDQQQATKS